MSFVDYTHNAHANRVPFNLTAEEFKTLVTGACFYCGSPPVEPKNPASKRLKNTFYGVLARNGIDRKEPVIGYVYKNCVSCCKTCNIAKHTMTLEEFKIWVRRVHSNLLG